MSTILAILFFHPWNTDVLYSNFIVFLLAPL